jgi:hypothetical protein
VARASVYCDNITAIRDKYSLLHPVTKVGFGYAGFYGAIVYAILHFTKAASKKIKAVVVHLQKIQSSI